MGLDETIEFAAYGKRDPRKSRSTFGRCGTLQRQFSTRWNYLESEVLALVLHSVTRMWYLESRPLLSGGVTSCRLI